MQFSGVSGIPVLPLLINDDVDDDDDVKIRISLLQ